VCHAHTPFVCIYTHFNTQTHTYWPGVLGLYQGLSPALVSVVPYMGVQVKLALVPVVPDMGI
jgi:hypothetical protein